ncbi:MAG: hypothetical protein GY903_21130 [Fuerstiella sp.]|nr:hypothetical protein [Fuerstiella sp.]MCP4856994.1 hypothetical protein [Fuerstiella sp.]
MTDPILQPIRRFPNGRILAVALAAVAIFGLCREIVADELTKPKIKKSQWKEKTGKSEKRKETNSFKEKAKGLKGLWKSKQRQQPDASPRTSTPMRGSIVNGPRYAPPNSLRKPDSERLTVDLPPRYEELDIDFDGQIGLHEWIVARRQDLAIFDAIDGDSDGLLTPRELRDFDSTVADAGQKSAPSRTYARPRLQIIGGTWHLTARGKKPTRDELPEGYNPGRGRSREESAKLHQNYVDRRMAGLTAQQKARIGQLWAEKKRNDPDMENAGASFVQIMEHVAENAQ